ncbi:MAG: BamA/TamA family outer membrane protein, partial [Nitrospira sp.]
STTGFRSAFVRDSRDNYMAPRSGTRMAFNGDLGSRYLGGSNNFYKVQVDTSKYTPLFWDTRHSIRARYGMAAGLEGRPVPLTEMFYVGGINTMRGFVFGRAGPVTPNGQLIGADRQVVINNDFIFPVSTEAKLDGVIFFDYGKGFAQGEKLGTKLRPTSGIEARWGSPFGPLRIAYGLNLDPKPLERKGVFEFTVGSLF